MQPMLIISIFSPETGNVALRITKAFVSADLIGHEKFEIKRVKTEWAEERGAFFVMKTLVIKKITEVVSKRAVIFH